MRILAFDGRTGASGDMILGALLDAGADPAVLSPVEDALGVTYEVGSTTREGIDATDVTVRRTTGEDGGREATDEEADELSFQELKARHEDDGSNGDDSGDDGPSESTTEHAAEAERPTGQPPAEGHGPARTPEEVRSIVASMGLPESVETDARAVFDLLSRGEAAVHGTDPEAVHFHEVGADDAIADVVGSLLLLEDLDPDRVVTTPLAAGSGEVTFSHGTYPVPTPAVTEIAARADWPIAGGPLEGELLTPTGAAILAHVAEGVERLPTLRVAESGYGAGDREYSGRPNVLRVLLGDGTGGLRREEITVLETNLDDASPEVLGSLQASLGEAGALDVTVLPATMKKSRPGHLVKVIAEPEDADRVASRLAEETGTLGVREHGAGHRWVADREVRSVELSIDGETHAIDVKVATDVDGKRFDVSAEYEDAREVAAATGVPVREIVQRAECAFEEP
ncbi:MAG: nickel pincer cofactor biosynthesis protein LarC [Halanaeroarchaeum sp.]